MTIELREEPMTALAEHARISIAFTVERLFEVIVVKDGLEGICLRERTVDLPYTKDSDAMRGEGPTRWAGRFDLSRWGLIAAYSRSKRVGGAVIAFDTPGVRLLEERTDLAVLWDLRVHPDHRGRGIGTALFRAAERWAEARACRHLKIETQNTNVPACKFYMRRGCVLGVIDRFAYPQRPQEAQLLWYKALEGGTHAAR